MRVMYSIFEMCLCVYVVCVESVFQKPVEWNDEFPFSVVLSFWIMNSLMPFSGFVTEKYYTCKITLSKKKKNGNAPIPEFCPHSGNPNQHGLQAKMKFIIFSPVSFCYGFFGIF